jgi:hypothetical protein
MTSHTLFYYPYPSFTNAQLPLLKVTALCFDRLVLLAQASANWAALGADHVARHAVRVLKSAGILEIVMTPATVSVLAASGSAAKTRRESVGAAVERTLSKRTAESKGAHHE